MAVPQLKAEGAVRGCMNLVDDGTGVVVTSSGHGKRSTKLQYEPRAEVQGRGTDAMTQ